MHVVKNKSYHYDIISCKSMEKTLNCKYYIVPKPDSGIKHNNSYGSIISNTHSTLKSNTNDFGMSQCSQDSLDGTATGWTATV
jgi:hypothetical protein